MFLIQIQSSSKIKNLVRISLQNHEINVRIEEFVGFEDKNEERE
jgi:hypothetical protein